jgi:hypothetical protein
MSTTTTLNWSPDARGKGYFGGDGDGSYHVQIARRDDTGADVWRVAKFVDGHAVIELGEAATLEQAKAIAETVNAITPFALAGLLIGGGYDRDCISRASIHEAFERLAIAAMDSAEFRAGVSAKNNTAPGRELGSGG